MLNVMQKIEINKSKNWNDNNNNYIFARAVYFVSSFVCSCLLQAFQWDARDHSRLRRHAPNISHAFNLLRRQIYKFFFFIKQFI